MNLLYAAGAMQEGLRIEERDGATVVTVGGRETIVDEFRIDERHVTLSVDGRLHRLLYYRRGAHLHLAHRGRVWEFAPLEESAKAGAGASGAFNPEVTSPMPGKVLDVLVAVGDEVEAQAPLLLLEAMKMETTIKAPAGARVVEISVEVGAMVGPGDLLLRLEEAETAED